ncbi:hypothetical protein [Streptomyces sp. DASNCL29]|uniref:hypothetical protein n=1 Tax=Streptomyces sp. DASNCL29 TaxID=2583819 RepID=UPI00110FE430|nr:hypothetical protein [Streptomyces sp. DASNCL29]TMV00048.1 hypothetical protein FGK60_21865 [Streptomyces sp. DASNCL29]
MALHVHVPVRVRLVEPVTAHELALLERAVGDACRTALRTARREVIDARGGGRRVRLDRPAPTFAGLNPGEGVRERAAEAVARGLAFGVSSSRLLRRRETPEVRTESPAEEAVDSARVDEGEAGTAYRVLSSGDRGTKVKVPLFRRPDLPPLRPAAGGVLSVNEAAAVAWMAHLDRAGPVWRPKVHGYPGYAGLVFADGKVRRALVWISGVTVILRDGTLPRRTYHENWQTLNLLKWEMADQGPPEFRVGSLTGGLSPFHELIRTKQPGTVEAIEKVIVELLEEGREPESHPLRAPVARRRYAEQLLAGATEPMVIYHLRGERRMFTVMKATTPSLIRFVTALPPAPTKKPPGERAHPKPGAKRGAAPPKKPEAKDSAPPQVPSPQPGPPQAAPPRIGPPEGGVDVTERVGGGEEPTPGTPGSPRGTGRGHLWPVTGINGEELSCTPYEGEPSLLALPHGGERLAADIRRIAHLLDVPDSCTFPGMFTLNCARLIATRARGVGLASVTSGVTTDVTVRSDGQGNNGFLDLRPGQALELRFMRLLGEIAGLVRKLANDVVATYQLPDNAMQHGADADWHPAAWSLWFLKEIHSALSGGCMHMYAETCRVLLLQQLRSSRAAIEERRGPRAEEALRRFTSALDTLGASVVRLLVLRRAVRHAERVGATGTLRTVLAVRETRYHAGYHEYQYQAAAPIASVSPRTLDELADARIERQGTAYVAVHGGRSWTVGELDDGINARRALVNVVDPLFLQAQDIEDLFRSAQDDPGHVRTYLTALLTAVADANGEMTRRAQEADDGAFFALETSQWVATQGGRDRRGLWFRLNGIQAMADDELLPYVRGLAEYSDGVNLAIGRKAGFDAVRQMFATAGVMVLGLLCAPLGAAAAGLVTGAVSVGLAVQDYLEARDKEQLYRSLEDPEALLQWQDVEAARLMAAVGLAFSVFDVGQVAGAARAIAGTAADALRVGRHLGAEAGVRAAVAETRRTLVAHMTEQMLRHALGQAVTQVAVMEAMEVLLPWVIGPVLETWMREQAVQHGTLAKAAPGPTDASSPSLAPGPAPAPGAAVAQPPPPAEPPTEGGGE